MDPLAKQKESAGWARTAGTAVTWSETVTRCRASTVCVCCKSQRTFFLTLVLLITNKITKFA